MFYEFYPTSKDELRSQICIFVPPVFFPLFDLQKNEKFKLVFFCPYTISHLAGYGLVITPQVVCDFQH